MILKSVIACEIYFTLHFALLPFNFGNSNRKEDSRIISSPIFARTSPRPRPERERFYGSWGLEVSQYCRLLSASSFHFTSHYVSYLYLFEFFLTFEIRSLRLKTGRPLIPGKLYFNAATLRSIFRIYILRNTTFPRKCMRLYESFLAISTILQARAIPAGAVGMITRRPLQMSDREKLRWMMDDAAFDHCRDNES